MEERRFTKRIKVIFILVLVVCVLFTYYITANIGVIQGANPIVDKEKKAYNAEEEAKITLEGTFIDREGNEITVSKEVGRGSKVIFSKSYAALLGYESQIYGRSGLRDLYSGYLTTGGKDGIGAYIQLTTVNALQEKAYKLLGNRVGSIVLLNNQTGEILCMVSRSDSTIEYDVNTIDENWDDYSKIDKFLGNRAIMAQDPPGSTFKMITACALVDTGNENYTFDDPGVYHGIHNAGKVSYGLLDMESALRQSCNTYFASAGDKVGKKNLKKEMKNFLLGETINLDFATLTSSFNVDTEDYLTAHTAFGQGETMISPLQIAMALQTITSGGKMMKPYVVKEIVDEGKTIYSGNPSVLKQSITESTAHKVSTHLHKVALGYGFDESTYGKIYAKTGTAQLANRSYNHTYLVWSNGQYTGIISADESTQSSFSLRSIAFELHNAVMKYFI